MEPKDFKNTWQKVRIDPGSDLPEEWKKFRGKVKISEDDKDKLIFDKEFLAHDSIDISSRIAKDMIEDKEVKIKKLVVTVSQPTDSSPENKAIIRLHKNRKKADAFLRDLKKTTGKDSPALIFDWEAPEDVLYAWDDAHEGKSLFEIDWELENAHSADLLEEVENQFYEQEMANKMDILGMRGQGDSGHEYFVLKLSSAKESTESIKEAFNKYIEEQELDEYGKVHKEYFIYHPADNAEMFDIFMNSYMNVIDTDEIEYLEDIDDFKDNLMTQFTDKFGNKIFNNKTVSNNKTEKTERKMNMSELDRKERIFEQGKELGAAVLEGAALAAADQTGELLLDLAQEMAKDIPFIQIALSSPEGREFIKFTMALMLQTLAYQTDFLPKKDLVLKAVNKQMTLSSYKIIAPQLAVLRKFALSLAEKGETMNKINEKMEQYTSGNLTTEKLLVEMEAEDITDQFK